MVVQIGRKVDSVVAGVICNNERDGVHVVHSDRAKVVLIEVRDVCRGLILSTMEVSPVVVHVRRRWLCKIGRKEDSVVAGVICNNERDGVHVVHSDRAKIVLIEVRDVCRGL